MTAEQLAFRCARRGGKCDCGLDKDSNCALERVLAQTPPRCVQCGGATQLEDRFMLDHQQTDGPGVTLQLVEIKQHLEQAGVEAWGAEVAVWHCEPCDLAEVQFSYDDAEAA